MAVPVRSDRDAASSVSDPCRLHTVANWLSNTEYSYKFKINTLVEVDQLNRGSSESFIMKIGVVHANTIKRMFWWNQHQNN